jgi:hypothetical protein
MGNISESMDSIISVGIGIFVLVLILSLTYQGYAQSNTQMATASWACNTLKADGTCAAANVISGVPANFTKYAGALPNTFGGSLQLAVFALVFIAVILAVVGALRGGGAGTSGGILAK